MASPWQKISFSNFLPPHCSTSLFIRYNFCSTGYDVFLTDLTNVWFESMDRRDVIRRALNNNTVIDPSEDQTQLRMLLSKIEQGLSCSQETDLQIYMPPSASGPVLRILAPLPAPLKGLEWSIYLQPSPKSDIKTRVVYPALQDCKFLSSQIQDLEGLIRLKDGVITRLLDKIEDVGMDMAAVFPSMMRIAGLKSNQQRDWLTKNMPGIAPYDNLTDRSLAFCPDGLEETYAGKAPSVSTSEPAADLNLCDLLPSHLDSCVFSGSLSRLQFKSLEPSSPDLHSSISRSTEQSKDDAFDDSLRLPVVSSSPLRAPESQSFSRQNVSSLPSLAEDISAAAETQELERNARIMGWKAKPADCLGDPSIEPLVKPFAKPETQQSSDYSLQSRLSLETPALSGQMLSPRKKRIGLVRPSKGTSTAQSSSKPNKQPILPVAAALELSGLEAAVVRPIHDDTRPSLVGQPPSTEALTTDASTRPSEDEFAKVREELRRAYMQQDAATKKKKRRI